MSLLQKTLSPAIVAAVICCVAAADRLTAATKNVVYTASGTFDTTIINGQDLFKLAGEPYSISIVANVATVPTKHGATWATYTNLTISGTVQSGLIPTPTTIQNKLTDIELATGNPSYDMFLMFTPVRVVNETLSIKVTIQMPTGTVPNALIHPFTAPVTLTPTVATMTYSNGTSSTTLGLNGTLNAAFSGGGASVVAPPVLHAAGARTVTAHEDGTQSVRSMNSAAVDLGAATDFVALEFYASRVRNASDVHVQIAGQEVPVLFAGAAGHFAGLDQISVQVPRSMAGMGDVEVAMTVDGQTANPVHVRIQ